MAPHVACNGTAEPGDPSSSEAPGGAAEKANDTETGLPPGATLPEGEAQRADKSSSALAGDALWYWTAGLTFSPNYECHRQFNSLTTAGSTSCEYIPNWDGTWYLCETKCYYQTH